MNMLVACLEDKSFEYQGSAGQLNQSSFWPYFWMPCVMGDDYLPRVNCPVKAESVDIRLRQYVHPLPVAARRRSLRRVDY